MSESRVLQEGRRQPFGQILLFAAVVVETVAISMIDSSIITPDYVVAAAVIGALAIGMVLVSRSGAAGPGSRLGPWLAVVPLIDLAACAVVRADVVEVLPAGSLLVVFPVIWLGFAFPLPLFVLGVIGSVFVTAFPLVRAGDGFAGPSDLAIVLTTPVVVALLGLAARATGRDLAERQRRADEQSERAQSALRASLESSALISALAETTPDALAVFDPSGHPVLANDAARALGVRAGRPGLHFDHDREADAGADSRGGTGTGSGTDAGTGDEVYHSADPEVPVPIGRITIKRALAGEFEQPTRVWVGREGDRVALSVVARPVLGADGEVTAVAMMGHDVTELVQAIEVRDGFLDTVGHELKTPLTVILGHAALLAESADPAAASSAAAIERAAERLGRIVDQLIAAGRDAIDPAPEAPVTDVASAVERLAADAERTAAGKGVDFGVVVEPGTGEARIAAADLETLLSAVLSNAVLYTEAGGSVVVGVRREADQVVVDVADTGVGMSADESRQAFDRFYRAPRSHRQAVPGTGLGLSLASAVATANGAGIRIDSQVNRGTVVTVSLPAA